MRKPRPPSREIVKGRDISFPGSVFCNSPRILSILNYIASVFVKICGLF